MPGQQFVDAVDLMLGNATKDIGEPSLWIDLVELGCLDQRIGSRRSSAASVVTVDRSFVLASAGMNKHFLGVAMSRHHDTTTVFAATGDAASPSQVAKIAGKAERVNRLRDGTLSPIAFDGL